MSSKSFRFLPLGLWVLLAAAMPASAVAQTGTIVGTITAQSGEPLPDVQVSVRGQRQGTLSQANGRYLLIDVPAGTLTIEALRIGYSSERLEVTVVAGETVVQDIELSVSVLVLDGLTVVGTIDPIAGNKVPFTIGKISEANLKVAQTGSAVASLQGKIAGVSISRSSGQPGRGVNVLLRTPTSIQRSNSPMYVVDGVILGGSTIDIEAMDIVSVEVVKGAAAASLYGSRAASGVIMITTNRGLSLDEGTFQIRARTEIGSSQIPRGIPLITRHNFLQTPAGLWVDENGAEVDRVDRVIDGFGFIDNDYTNGIHDNLGALFNAGQFMTNTLSVSRNGEAVNFLASFNRYDEAGSLRNNSGYERNSYRLNLDGRITDDLTIGVSAFHSRSHRDDTSGDPFADVIRWFEPDIDLSAIDPLTGDFVQQPDINVQVDNPIWRQQSRDNFTSRSRTLASGNLNWRTFDWLSLRADFSYDRNDRNVQVYVPLGTETSSSDDPLDGQLSKNNFWGTALNGSLSATFRRDIGPLNTRTTVRGIFEREKDESVTVTGSELAVLDLPDLSVATVKSINSSLQEIRSTGYLADLALDYDGKYIGSLLVRRDGSSLFGVDARWNDYFRGAVAYRMAEEQWWPFEGITEFKVRGSVGTAGGRPNFADQYETWSYSGTTGSVTKSTLGNKNLKPEKTREVDIGIDLTYQHKYSLQFSYVESRTEDALMQLPQPAITGYRNQWVNAGVMEGKTYELTIEAQLINTRDLSWSMTFVADQSRSEITSFDRPCFRSSIQFFCAGHSLSDMWGQRFATSLADLPASLDDIASQFQVNDEGLLVWVGEGNSWRDGVSGNLWGTTFSREGVTYQWGNRIVVLDDEGNPVIEKIGDSRPDLAYGWLNNVRWKGVDLHLHLQGQMGGNVYNNARQKMMQNSRHADADQTGKADDLKKPFGYYNQLYNGNFINPTFVEPGWFLKVRAVSLSYTLRESLLSSLGLSRLGLNNLSIAFVGRNLFTFTDYKGYDPDIGTVLDRYDSRFTYPNMRNFSLSFDVNF